MTDTNDYEPPCLGFVCSVVTIVFIYTRGHGYNLVFVHYTTNHFQFHNVSLNEMPNGISSKRRLNMVSVGTLLISRALGTLSLQLQLVTFNVALIATLEMFTLDLSKFG